ncbi:centrosomal protein of 164 kDa [Anopheles ziemanni]|uniref:centrosomal protein of 164 kDa n=1 Tax=Anopheles coustani TaxID=139045 RepID=UPI0026594324|nr:centrosomal protein of 164 kDa [Anopheles coustani]XP_058177759.1 centrosomal protein of 164 kDa [Anopheles ziemanni]
MNSSSYGTGIGQQEEIFYSTYEPTKEEILEYALKIGIDPDKETNLIYLARQGLLHPLPENWKPCYSKQVKAYYYYDRITKKSQWEHPIDVLYRAKVADARKALSLDRSDSTSLGDSGFRSLKSANNKCDPCANVYQPDASNQNHEIVIPPSVHISTDLKAGKKETDQRFVRDKLDTALELGQIEGTHSEHMTSGQIDAEEEEESDSYKKNNSQEAVITSTKYSGAKQRNSAMTLSSKLLFNISSSVREGTVETHGPNETPVLSGRMGLTAHAQSFTITGTGSQFLKSNKKPEFGGLEIGRKLEPEVKGILRDSSLTYVRNKSTPNEDSGSDERKSVRFDIDLNAELKPSKETVRDDSLINFEEIDEAYDNDSDDKRDRVDEEDGYDEADNESEVLENVTGNRYQTVYKQADIGLGVDDVEQLSSSDSDVPVVTDKIDRMETRPGQTVPDDRGVDSARLLKQTLDRERTRYRARLEEELSALETLEEANLQKELAKVHQRYEELLEKEKKKLEEQHQQNINEIKEFYQVKLNEMKADYEEENAKEYTVYRETLQEEFDRRVQEVTDEHRATMATLQKNHDEIVEELERDLKTEEELLKKEHTTNLTEMKIKLSHELEVERQRMRETGEDRLYEKVRCEKRLLEDKYKCLKEKYTRLKTDVRISLERRKKRREQQQHSLLSNSYETDDRTNSKPLPPYPYDIGKGISGPSSGHTVLTSEKSSISTPPPSAASKRFPVKGSYLLEGKNKLLHYNGISGPSDSRKPLMTNQNNNNNVNNNNNIPRTMQTDDTSQSETTYSKNYFQIRNIFASVQQCEGNISSDSEFDKQHREKGVPIMASGIPHAKVEAAARPKRKIFTKTKSASTSKLNATKHEREAGSGRPCTPVENLRIQLKKLEELEDQIPDCNLDAPYHLRYPFVHDHVENSGTGNVDGVGAGGATGTCGAIGSSNGSSELEFFKHRVLLERDSVMRAKESLRAQKHLFKTKQHDVSIKHAMKNKHTMDQIFNEEKELTEMEVSLHRTRAILGEKVIRLRHLERSLQKLSEKERPKMRSDGIDRALQPKETLSDLSSYSSSGFSSNELPIAEHNYGQLRTTMAPSNDDPFKYLEHLHAEIQEIWSLLNPGTGSVSVSFDEMDFLNNTNTITGNRICDMVLPPTPATPITTKLSSVAQPMGVHLQNQRHRYTVNLLEKTRDLKNWLRNAKSEHEMLKKNTFG